MKEFFRDWEALTFVVGITTILFLTLVLVFSCYRGAL